MLFFPALKFRGISTPQTALTFTFLFFPFIPSIHTLTLPPVLAGCGRIWNPYYGMIWYGMVVGFGAWSFGQGVEKDLLICEGGNDCFGTSSSSQNKQTRKQTNKQSTKQ